MALVEERHRFAACTVVGRVLGLNLSEQSFGARAADCAVHPRQPRLEGWPAVVELLEPGPVPRQKVLGDKSLLIEECAHRGGVVDEGELAADRHAGHRRGVPEREKADRADDTDRERGAHRRQGQPGRERRGPRSAHGRSMTAPGA